MAQTSSPDQADPGSLHLRVQMMLHHVASSVSIQGAANFAVRKLNKVLYLVPAFVCKIVLTTSHGCS